MRLSKFLLSAFVITFLALAYVYQQSKIFYLAYQGGRQQADLTNLLDKNNLLRYNINRLSSLTYLDNKILRNLELEMPLRKQLVRFGPEQEGTHREAGFQGRTNLIVSFFGRARQAEAQTLNRFPPK